MSLPKASALFAAEVQYWRLDPDCWRPVLEAAVSAGLPGVSTYVPWEIHELGPGQFDFDGHTDPRKNLVRYLDLLKELGLKLAYRPGPFCCNEMDYGGHPRRVVTADPAWMCWRADGTPLPGYQLARKEGWSPCYLHPAYLDEVRRWFAAVDAVAAPYSAARGGPIATCNLDNEISYIAKDAYFNCDYNPCIVGAGGLWHQWLGETYGTPDRLPYAGPAKDFREVQPPRALGSDVASNLRWYLDWAAFKEWLMVQYLERLKAMHREAGLTGVDYYTNLNPHRPEGVPTNFRAMGRATGGLVGYDFYRGPWLTYSGYASMARVLKLMDATLPVTWSAEFMGGWWYTDMGKGRIPKSHTEFMGLAAMANGCKAISWFMFHDRRAWGDSPVSEMGHPRENHEALQNLLGVVRAIPEWEALRVVNDFAVAYVRPYQWHAHLGDPNPCADNNLHRGEPVLWGSRAGDAVAEYEAVFRVAQQAGYSAGVVELEGGVAGPAPAGVALAQTELLWLPGAAWLCPVLAAELRAWVERGGTLVVSGEWPRVNLDGQPLAFLGLAERPTGRVAVGQGQVVWCPVRLADLAPEEEPADVVAQVKALLAGLAGAPVADVSRPPVRYETFGQGGIAIIDEKPVLVDALLQRGRGATLLWLVNLHQRAVAATVRLRDVGDGELREIGFAAARFPLCAGAATIPLDCKRARVFRVVA